ncbi:hypothetical protein DSUL_50188 [Desulfovibrionales bacterium]
MKNRHKKTSGTVRISSVFELSIAIAYTLGAIIIVKMDARHIQSKHT